MKIDLVGPARRGLAMGLNEAAGYFAAGRRGLGLRLRGERTGCGPSPSTSASASPLAGLLLSVFVVRETRGHARHEAGAARRPSDPSDGLSFGQIFALTSWRTGALFAASQAGLVNNLNDGMAWGLFPLFFAAGGLDIDEIAILAALYPGRLGPGPARHRRPLGPHRSQVADRRRHVGPGGGDLPHRADGGFAPWALGGGAAGLGTAMVYPTLLAAIGDVAHPEWRASAVGVYRLWRDGGYAIGALLAGIVADVLGLALGDLAGRGPDLRLRRRGGGRHGRDVRGKADGSTDDLRARHFVPTEDRMTARRGFATRIMHAGEAPDPSTGAHGVPLYGNSTYAFRSYEQVEAFEAGRTAFRLRALWQSDGPLF